MKWMLLPLKRFAQFNGRSRRKEFWMFLLFLILVGFVLRFVDAMLGLGGDISGTTTSAPGTVGAMGGMRRGIISSAFSVAMTLPNLAVAVRRLHDTNHSGWWVVLPVGALVVAIIGVVGAGQSENAAWGILSGLAMLTAGVSGIVLFVWYCMAGTPGPNRFGADPKADIASDLAQTFE